MFTTISGLLAGEANLLGDITLLFFTGETVDVRGFSRLDTGGAVFFIGDAFLYGDIVALLDVDQSFFVGDTIGFLGEKVLFLVGDPKRLLGLLDIVFFFLAGDLAGDFSRGSVAVLMTAN